MNIGKLSNFKNIIILAALVLVAVIGITSIAYTSAKAKKAVSDNTQAYGPTYSTKPVGAVSTGEDTMPAGRLEITDNISKAVLKIDNMSCSGCIYTIKSSIAGITGIQDILVNLSSGQAEIYYDNTQVKDVNTIADAITAGGYPAKVTEVLSAGQIRKERDIAAARALNYIASVNQLDISRQDFNTELEHAKSRYALTYGDAVFTDDQGKALMDNLKVQIVSRLINEGIQMQEIQKAGFTVDSDTVDVEFRKFLNQKGIDLEEFKTHLKENGYSFDYFMKKFETRVLINKYLDDEILDGATDNFEKQRRYASWFNNARLLSKVSYYDKELERLIQTRAAGSGCSAGGNRCSGN